MSIQTYLRQRDEYINKIRPKQSLSSSLSSSSSELSRTTSTTHNQIQSARVVPYAALHIDATLHHLLKAFTHPLSLSSVKAPLPPVLNDGHWITTLSVRSALSLYISTHNPPFAAYSQILVTAITIPDMISVLEYYKLIPIPVDILETDLSPDLHQIDALVTPKTVAILVAQIYGRGFSMDPIIQRAKMHNLEVWEDRAEGFRSIYEGTSDELSTRTIEINYSSEAHKYKANPFDRNNYVQEVPVYPLGHPQSDVTFFSFGPIKTCTAFGGALTRVSKQSVRDKMQEAQAQWPQQSVYTWYTRCFKIAIAMALLNFPTVTGSTIRIARFCGVDHKELLVSMIRSFPKDKLIQQIHNQPHPSMISLLHERVQNYCASEILSSSKNCDILTALLPARVAIPGASAPVRNYWLYPILCPLSYKVSQMVSMLNIYGVDAYVGATQLCLVPTPEVDTQLNISKTKTAADIMNRVIYLPMHAKVPVDEIVYISAVVWVVVDLLSEIKIKSLSIKSSM